MSKISGEKPKLTEEQLLELLAVVRAPPAPNVHKKDDDKVDSPVKSKKPPLPVVGEKVEEELIFVNGGEQTPPKVGSSKPKESKEPKEPKTSSAAIKKQAVEDFNKNVLDRLATLEQVNKTYKNRLDCFEQDWPPRIDTGRDRLDVIEKKLNKVGSSSNFSELSDIEETVTNLQGKINQKLQKQFASKIYVGQEIEGARAKSIKVIKEGIAGNDTYVKKEVNRLWDRVDSNDSYSKYAIKGIKDTFTETNIEYDNKLVVIEDKVNNLAKTGDKKRSRESSVAASLDSNTLAGSVPRKSRGN